MNSGDAQITHLFTHTFYGNRFQEVEKNKEYYLEGPKMRKMEGLSLGMDLSSQAWEAELVAEMICLILRVEHANPTHMHPDG